MKALKDLWADSPIHVGIMAFGVVLGVFFVVKWCT